MSAPVSYTNDIKNIAALDNFISINNCVDQMCIRDRATKEYIYAPDADEVLDEINRRRFMMLKAALLPEIEIVQMKYITPHKYNTIQNAAMEYRPKLYKRLRTFTWVNPVHETVDVYKRQMYHLVVCLCLHLTDNL